VSTGRPGGHLNQSD